MSNRCPDCNKFVSLEAEEPEAEFEADDDGAITGTVTITLNCAECGTSMRSGEFEAAIDLTEKFEAHKTATEVTYTVTVIGPLNGVEEEIEVPEEIKFTVEATPATARQLAEAGLDQAILAARAQGKIRGDGPFAIRDVEIETEHELEVEAESEATTERRKGVNCYGHQTTLTISCACGKFDHSEALTDDMPGSMMDEA